MFFSFWSSSLLVRVHTLNVEKYGFWDSNTDLCIYYVFSLPTKISLKRLSLTKLVKKFDSTNIMSHKRPFYGKINSKDQSN